MHAVQVGVHGAGLVNAYFLRPGSAVVEVLPCDFGVLDPWPSQYFFEGSRLEARARPV
jgi:capsular polysaccharide biosynthesis protein